MHSCPKCGSNRVHHAPPATVSQRIRRRLTRKSMFRCATCGHIAWKREHRHYPRAEHITPYEEPKGPPPDLQALDEALSRTAKQER